MCGKQCGLDIELHHIDPTLSSPALNAIDNAIPACYECHAKLEFSLLNSPRGSKFSPQEIKQRRDQIYDEKTRHLVPVLLYGPNNEYPFPKVQFFITNIDGGLEVKARCVVEIHVNGKFFGTPIGHYSGSRLWACNPGLSVLGWFDLADRKKLKKTKGYKGLNPSDANGKDLRLRVHLAIIDVFEREHHRIPVEWYYDWQKQAWVYDP